MKHRTLLPDAGEVVLDQLMVEGNCRLVMVLRATGEAGCCPVCGKESRRIHSRYKRRLKDLPWEGIPVRIELRVRRFFCRTENCGQQVFTERLPNTVQRYARRTCRHRYGTILCDLERGKVVDLLPDRSSESTAQWLRTHPGAEIVSRDRASLYAQAATAAAPHAVQVADRWHLLHNLSEAFIGALVPHHRLLIEAAQASASKTEAPTTLAVLPSVVTTPTSRYQQKQQHNRERRLASYQAVMEQISKGVTQTEVAQRSGLGIRTIRRWIRARGFPERKIGDRKSTVDEYSEYLELRWNEGCHNATQLWHELRARGFAGQAPIVRTWVRRRYGSRKDRTGQQPPLHSPLRVSPRQTAWTLLKEPEDARSYVEELCRRSSQIATCASIAREFVRIIRQRDTVAWKKWKEDAKSSQLASFAKHLCLDEAALMADLQHLGATGQSKDTFTASS